MHQSQRVSSLSGTDKRSLEWGENVGTEQLRNQGKGITVRIGAVHGKGVDGSLNIHAAKRYGEGTTKAFGCVVLLGIKTNKLN